MVKAIQGNSNMDKFGEKEHINMIMGMFMRDNSYKAISKEKVLCATKMDLSTKGSGKKMRSMERELGILQMKLLKSNNGWMVECLND